MNSAATQARGSGRQRSRIPLGIFRNLVLEKTADGTKGFDAKAQAILPLIAIARTFALSEGISAVGTLERLAALAAAGRMAKGDAESLKDAFLLVNELRIAHQAAQLRRGKALDYIIEKSRINVIEDERSVLAEHHHDHDAGEEEPS